MFAGFFCGQPVRCVGGFAVIEDDHAPRTNVEQRAIVRREEHRRPRFVDVFEQAEDVDRQLWIEVTRRFVRKNQGRFAHDGSRDRDTLLFTTGQPLGLLRAFPRQTYAFERFADASTHDFRRQSDDFERDGDVVGDSPARNELEVLEDVADVAPQRGNGLMLEATDIATEKKDASFICLLDAVDEPQQRTLARTRGSRDENELTTLDGQGQTLEYGLVGAVRLVQILEDEDGTRSRQGIESMPGSKRRSKQIARRECRHDGESYQGRQKWKTFRPKQVQVFVTRDEWR